METTITAYYFANDKPFAETQAAIEAGPSCAAARNACVALKKFGQTTIDYLRKSTYALSFTFTFHRAVLVCPGRRRSRTLVVEQDGVSEGRW